MLGLRLRQTLITFAEKEAVRLYAYPVSATLCLELLYYQLGRTLGAKLNVERSKGRCIESAFAEFHLTYSSLWTTLGSVIKLRCVDSIFSCSDIYEWLLRARRQTSETNPYIQYSACASIDECVGRPQPQWC